MKNYDETIVSFAWNIIENKGYAVCPYCGEPNTSNAADLLNVNSNGFRCDHYFSQTTQEVFGVKVRYAVFQKEEKFVKTRKINRSKMKNVRMAIAMRNMDNGICQDDSAFCYRWDPNFRFDHSLRENFRVGPKGMILCDNLNPYPADLSFLKVQSYKLERGQRPYEPNEDLCAECRFRPVVPGDDKCEVCLDRSRQLWNYIGDSNNFTNYGTSNDEIQADFLSDIADEGAF